MVSPHFLIDIIDGIMTITFNRPKKKNAVSVEMMRTLRKILDDAASNDSVDFVVLTGSGDYYSSGADISSLTSSAEVPDVITVGRELFDTFIDFPKLLIAVVNGPAVGMAVTSLALCDLVYCSAETTFSVPFCLHGLNAEGCSSYLFPRIMGVSRANEVLQFGRKFNATEAKQWGFVSEVYETDQLKSVVMSKLGKMRNSLVLQSVRANKKLIREWDSKKLHEVNAAEWKELEARFLSPEFIAAIIRFSQRKNVEHKL